MSERGRNWAGERETKREQKIWQTGVAAESRNVSLQIDTSVRASKVEREDEGEERETFKVVSLGEEQS